MAQRLPDETEVAVIGAGPVGLFTALALATRGVRVAIVDRAARGSSHSYALALHPTTLRLLDQFGLAGPLLKLGHRVERVAFYEDEHRLGHVDLSALGGLFPFLLVLPQDVLEHELESALLARGVRISWQHQVLNLIEDAGGVQLELGRMERCSMGYTVEHSEWLVDKLLPCRASYVVGADGHQSFARTRAELGWIDLGAPEIYSVFEFRSGMEIEDELRVAFHGRTLNVAWPLGAGRGRCGFETGSTPVPASGLDGLRRLLAERMPWLGEEIDGVSWEASVEFERRLVERFGRGRLSLVGDAAHVTGPVGVQSMNIGMREAYDLAERLSALLHDAGSFSLLDQWAADRQREWTRLLSGELHLTDSAPEWVRRHPARLTSCLPASNHELTCLLAQLGASL